MPSLIISLFIRFLFFHRANAKTDVSKETDHYKQYVVRHRIVISRFHCSSIEMKTQQWVASHMSREHIIAVLQQLHLETQNKISHTMLAMKQSY